MNESERVRKGTYEGSVGLSKPCAGGCRKEIVISTPRVKWELFFRPKKGFLSPEGVVFGPRNDAISRAENNARGERNSSRDEKKVAPISHKVWTLLFILWLSKYEKKYFPLQDSNPCPPWFLFDIVCRKESLFGTQCWKEIKSYEIWGMPKRLLLCMSGTPVKTEYFDTRG